MKKLFAALAFAGAFFLSYSADADSGIRRTPCGYQQITSLSAATKLTIPTTICAANTVTAVRIVAEAQAVRWRDDGTAPTASVGQPLAVGVELAYEGSIANIQFIEQTSAAKLNVLFYK
jgi:hypothetical protein